MLSNEEMNDLLAGFDARMSGINSHYISLMAEHIRDIGQLTASDVDRLEAMRRVSGDMDVVKREIAAAANLSDKELEQIFTRTVESGIDFLNTVFGRGTISLENNYGLQNLLKAQILQTKADLKNFSNTTVVSKYYRQGVDRAIQAVRSGMEDYKTAIRSVVRQNASEGLRVLTDEQGMRRREGQNSPLVRYESGITRRLDTAARQNILDGVRQLNQQCMNLVGQQLGADGVEISAHILCAEDHIDYQGEQFTNEEFDRIQNELQRPFGQWNCRHMWWPVFIGVSKPSNDPETLEAYRQYSREQITIIADDGREITRSRYEWTQEQRRLETAIRQQKDVGTAARIIGDKDLERQCGVVIRRYDAAYRKISDGVGLEESRRRMTGALSVLTNSRTRVNIDTSNMAFASTTRMVNKLDNLFVYSNHIKPLDGYDDLVCHGDPYSFINKTADGVESNIPAADVCQWYKDYGLYTPGNRIRLLSCNTGVEPAIPAHVVADTFGVEVMAPTGAVALGYVNGDEYARIYVLDDDDNLIPDELAWRLIRPKKG